MREEIEISDFTAGELSPRLKGRFDLTKYFKGLDTELNMVTLPQGGATKRPGTLFVALAKDQSPGLFRTITIPFIFSTVQAYQLEASNGNIRVYMNDGVVLNGGNPVDIAVPYTAADLPALGWTQSADTLYLVHPNYPPATLTRSSHTSWSYQTIAFRDGPYLAANTSATTLTPSATSGAITVAASSIQGINNSSPGDSTTGQGFLAGDVGRLIRIQIGSSWGWVKITAVNSTTSVNATVQAAVTGVVNGAAGALGGTTATSVWQLGAWSGTTGYPFRATFWQQRLFFGGSSNQPNELDGSVSGDFTNMAPSDASSTVTAAHAMRWIMDDDQVNAVRWLSAAGTAQAPQLGVGTSGSEQIFQAATPSQALAPTNIMSYRETTYGSAVNVPVLRIGKSVLFFNSSGRKLHEWTFAFIVNGFLGPDLLEYSEHITRGLPGAPRSSWGVRTAAWQQRPHGVIWAARNDGTLLSFTYDGPAGPATYGGQQVFAPARHQLGGQYYGGPPIVESLTSIPSSDGTYDELWLCVMRTINGTPTRTIEVMTPYFDGFAPDQAFFVDCALQSALSFPNATLTPSGFTPVNAPGSTPQTLPQAYSGTGTLTASTNVFSSGDVGKVVRLNNGRLAITQFTDAQHVQAQVLVPMASLIPAAANAWSSTALSSSFSGLSYLNGETVAILGDGAVYPPQVVAGGAVSLTGGGPGASLATIGLPYTPVLVTMPFEPQRAAQQIAGGKTKRVDTLWLRFHETLGCDFGRRITDPMTKMVTDYLEPLESRSAADAMGEAPPLFSGAKRLVPQGGFDLEGQVVVTQEEPLPLTVLSLFASADVTEMDAPDA